jgi:hypothetical protein
VPDDAIPIIAAAKMLGSTRVYVFLMMASSLGVYRLPDSLFSTGAGYLSLGYVFIRPKDVEAVDRSAAATRLPY